MKITDFHNGLMRDVMRFLCRYECYTMVCFLLDGFVDPQRTRSATRSLFRRLRLGVRGEVIDLWMIRTHVSCNIYES